MSHPIQRIENVQPGDHDKAKTKFTELAVGVIKKKNLRVMLNHPGKSMFYQIKEHVKTVAKACKGVLGPDETALFNAFENIGNNKGPYDNKSLVMRGLALYQRLPKNRFDRKRAQVANDVNAQLDMGGSPASQRGSPVQSEMEESPIVRTSPVQEKKVEENHDALLSIESIEKEVKKELFPGLEEGVGSVGLQHFGSPGRAKVEKMVIESVKKILHAESDQDGIGELRRHSAGQDVIEMCMNARKAVLKLKSIGKHVSMHNQAASMDQGVESSGDESESDKDIDFEEQKDDDGEKQEEEKVSQESCSHSPLVTNFKELLNKFIGCSGIDGEDKERKVETFYSLQATMKHLRVCTIPGRGQNVSAPVSDFQMLRAMITGNLDDIPIMKNSEFYGNDDKKEYTINHGTKVISLYTKDKIEKVGDKTVKVDKLTKIAGKLTTKVLWFYSDILKELFSNQDYEKISAKLGPQGSNWYTVLRLMNKKYSENCTLERTLETGVSRFIEYDVRPTCALSKCPFTKDGKLLSLVKLMEHLNEVYTRACVKMLKEKYGCTLDEAQWSHINEMSGKIGSSKLINERTKGGEELPMTYMTKMILAACKTIEYERNDAMDIGEWSGRQMISNTRPWEEVMEINGIMVAELFAAAKDRPVIAELEELLAKPKGDETEEEVLINYEIHDPLSVKPGTLSVSFVPMINFHNLKKSSAVKKKSKDEKAADKTKFEKLMKAKYLRSSNTSSPKPIRMPLNVNSTSLESEQTSGYEDMMHAVFAADVTGHLKPWLTVHCSELCKGGCNINVLDLIKVGLEHSKHGKKFQAMPKKKQQEFCAKLQKATWQKMTDISNKTNQINSTETAGKLSRTAFKKRVSKEMKAKEYKYVLAQDSNLDTRGKSEEEWKAWCKGIQCKKCGKYGHYSPDCTEM